MNAVISGDGELVAKKLAFKITELDPTIRIAEILPSVKTALNGLGRSKEPDLVFADIALAGGMSFDIVKPFQLSCLVSFVTAYKYSSEKSLVKTSSKQGLDSLKKWGGYLRERPVLTQETASEFVVRIPLL